MNYHNYLILSILLSSLCYAADPCLDYQEGTNHCRQCSESYEYALINDTTTLCATKRGNECILDHQYYKSDPAFDSLFKFFTTEGGSQGYCFNCTTFFRLPDGRSLCYSGCPKTPPKNILEFTTEKQSLGCNICALEDYQMQTLLDYSFIGLTVKTCTETINMTHCSFQEFYDPLMERCVACFERYPKCSSCNQSTCLLPMFSYYFGQNYYDYSSWQFNLDKLQFFLCSPGTAAPLDGNTCQPVPIDNCAIPSLGPGGEESCRLCNPGYRYENQKCTLLSQPLESVTYFIKSGAPHNFSNAANLEALFIDGTTVDSPFYFLSTAIQDAIKKGAQHSFVNATFYLGKGDHFFFYCNNLTGTIFNTESIIKYCQDYPQHLTQEPVLYDNITMKVTPLYCSLETALGYEDNLNFQELCVNETTDSNPTIFLNQAYGYFEVFGAATFENLHFSGLNQLNSPVIESNDLSVIPIKFCQVVSEPEIGQQLLDLKVVEHTDFNIYYKCTNQNYSGSTIPSQEGSSHTCNRNGNFHFYKEQESTLSCAGEPSYYYYFYQSHNSFSYQVTARRTNTVFNLIALPDYMTGYAQPPQLSIVNCTFEYFLSNYESLVSIQNQDFQFMNFNEELSEIKDLITFYFSNRGERGAKVDFINTEVKHSSFCKGMIVYRKQPFIDNDAFGYGNFSYILMRNPYVLDAGSYIVLENSRFININSGFQNISALALYRDQEVWREAEGYGNVLSYQGFIHKGSILNIQDFGGYIYIRNCTFEHIMHFIPQILPSPITDSLQTSVAMFVDNSQTQELKMAVCDEATGEDLYFFTHGLSESDDVETFYDAYERLSTIYISRNRDMVIIENNTFLSNVGTFGGAISINSQNWDAGKQPFIIVQDNNFTNNMAYLSGNAVYIRNSVRLGEENTTCGGVLLARNSFSDNVGGVYKSNGGAVSISCKLLGSSLQHDYYSSSSQYLGDSQEKVEELTQVSNPHTSREYQVYQSIVNIENNTFQRNLAGSKGTALFVQYINRVRIINCSFTENGPLLSVLESTISPYAKFFSQRSLIFASATAECSNEFEYLVNCQNKRNLKIKWSNIYGAIYVGHCESIQCFHTFQLMDLLIKDSIFNNNQVGYVLDSSFLYNLSSQIQIVGGLHNVIDSCNFIGLKAIYQNAIPEELKEFFPTGYFEGQQASLIAFQINSRENIDVLHSNAIRNCQFADNKHYQIMGLTSRNQYQGSLLRLTWPYGESTSKETPIMSVENCQFTNNIFAGPNSQLIYVYNFLVTIKESTFTHNGGVLVQESQMNQNQKLPFKHFDSNLAQDFGILYLDGIQQFDSSYSHLIFNNTFTYTVASYSAILHANIGNQFLNMSTNKFTNNIATEGGIITSKGNVKEAFYGGVLDEGKFRTNSTLSFCDNTFQHQISFLGTFSFTVSDADFELNLIVKSSQFESNFQSDLHGLISLSNMKKVIISNSQFSVIDAISKVEESFLMDQDNIPANNHEEVIERIFEQDEEIYFGGNRFLKASNTKSSQRDLYFQNQLMPVSAEYSAMIEINDCSFENFHSPSKGALILLTMESSLVMSNSQRGINLIRKCEVADRGIVFMHESTFVGINLDISNSRSDSSAALFYISENSECIIHNSTFANNEAETEGMISMNKDSSFSCDFCELISNTVDSGVSFFSGANNQKRIGLKLTNSYFTGNKGLSSLIYLHQTDTFMENCTFIDNFASSGTNGILNLISNIQLRNVFVNYTDVDYLTENNIQVETGFLYMKGAGTLHIEDSHFENCRGAINGFMFVQSSQSSAVIKTSRFVNNKSFLNKSPMIRFIKTTPVTITDSLFIGNSQIDLRVQGSVLVVKNVTFEKGGEKFIEATKTILTIEDSSFRDLFTENTEGGGVACQCIESSIRNSTFYNLTGALGGALYLRNYGTRTNTFLIEDSLFFNNKGQQGGALYVQDANQVIIRNNEFRDNRAYVIKELNMAILKLPKKAFGGGIYFQCKTANLACIYDLEGNHFTNNQAENDGGAILRAYKQINLDQTNVFQNNSAPYGKDIASYQSQLVIFFLQNNDYYDPINKTSVLQTDNITSLHNATFEGVVSGTPFSFLIYVIDQFGDLYTTDTGSLATVQNVQGNVLEQKTNAIINSNQQLSQNGVFNFSNIEVVVEPGSSLTLEIKISGMYDFNLKIPFLEETSKIQVNLRQCVAGEQLVNLECHICPSGTYLYEAPRESETCKICNTEVSICDGGTIVYPRQGYWRNTSTSEDWLNCPRETTCLEGNRTQLTYNCLEGHDGLVCGSCKKGYSKVGDFQCGKCPPKVKNILKITFIFIAIVLIVIGLVISSMSSMSKTKSNTSVYIKIMTSHLQIISALAYVSFSWPIHIEKVYMALVSVSKVSEQMFSIDCFLEDSNSGLVKKFGIYFSKLLVYAFLPFFLAFASLVFWLIVLTCKKQLYKLTNYFVGSLVILLFLVHPTITEAMFQAFNCVKIGETIYLRGDIQFECYNGKHLRLLILIVIPSIICWSFGIPIFALITLARKRQLIIKGGRGEELTEEEIIQMKSLREKYGFIFSGFKPESYNYEIVIQFRKILLIMITIIFSVVSPEIQALLSFFVLIVSMLYQYANKPFLTPNFNKLELLSLAVASITLYAGMYFITGQHYDYYQNKGLQWTFLILLILPNFGFFFLWLILLYFELLKTVARKSQRIFCLLSLGLVSYATFERRYLKKTVKQGESPEYQVEEIPDHSYQKLNRPVQSSVGSPQIEVKQKRKDKTKEKKRKSTKKKREEEIKIDDSDQNSQDQKKRKVQSKLKVGMVSQGKLTRRLRKKSDLEDLSSGNPDSYNQRQ